MWIRAALPIHPKVVATVHTADWASAVATVLEEPERIRPVFQPIFDLQRGVVCGFEMLARFDHELQATPDKWFAAAARLGVATSSKRRCSAAGSTRATASPATASSPSTSARTRCCRTPPAPCSPDATSTLIVVEVTESAPVHDYEALLCGLRVLRAQGASVAVDDAGAGYASLNHVIHIRPDFVKLDRALVMDVDRDPAKHALVETFGLLSGRLDAWLLAEGIERDGEREVLAAMGVPLAQGFGLARPAPALDATTLIAPAPPLHAGLRTLISTAFPALGEGERTEADTAVVVDERHRPLGVLTHGRLSRPPLCALTTDAPADVAQRALTRPHAQRFDPICCIDELGRLVGLIPFEQHVRHLAQTERTHP